MVKLLVTFSSNLVLPNIMSGFNAATDSTFGPNLSPILATPFPNLFFRYYGISPDIVTAPIG
ncbi:hypothetical protein GCM10017706_03070 [Lactococcus lactis subsp. hordniae]